MIPSQLVALLCMINAHYAPAPAPDRSLYIPPNLYLVRTNTIYVGKATRYTGLLRVTRVLLGPERLMGKEFECEVGPVLLISYIDPRLDRGRIEYLEAGEGLWWVYEDPVDHILRSELRPFMVHRYQLQTFPYQKEATHVGWFVPKPLPPMTQEEAIKLNAARKWQEGEVWAKVVMALDQAKSEEARRVILEESASNADSAVSAWAMVLLARGPREPAVKFLTGLADKDKLDPRAQASLDRVLCQIDRDSWVKSPKRLQMLTRWIDDETDKKGHGIGAWSSRLMEAQEAGDLDVDTYITLLSPITKPNYVPLATRQYHLCSLLIDRIFPATERDRAFKFLTSAYRNAKDISIRTSAVTGLHRFRPLSESEQDEIRELIKLENDPSFTASLRVLLPQPK